MRASGVLMPVFSLPGKYGIGGFTKEAYEFVDFLKEAGQTYWQILPVGPTSYGDSPYQSFSTFAGNPYFIDLEALIEEGVLTAKDCKIAEFGKSGEEIDYGRIYETRFTVLRKAFENTDLTNNKAFEDFKSANSHWLGDYALFMALKDAHDGASFFTWEDGIRLRKEEALKEAEEKYADDKKFYEYLQYKFYEQWSKLKAYANKAGVLIIGDIPIYVAADSSDVWSHPELFQMNENGEPKAVAGCPPDAFSETGQLWGNPLYDWKHHKNTGYKWWISRLRACSNLYDVIRIDHFRGFDAYWSIPAEDDTAMNGKWVKGPGYDLFKKAQKKLGKQHIIAEDLGLITDSVRKLVETTGFPNMKVIAFAWDGRDLTKPGETLSDYLPFAYNTNCVVYTGTHDNETLVGWMKDSTTEEQLEEIKAYIGTDSDDFEVLTDGLIRLAQASVADTCIIPIQDYLHLDNSARVNFPSTLGGNWVWRMKDDALTDELAAKMHQMAVVYGRL